MCDEGSVQSCVAGQDRVAFGKESCAVSVCKWNRHMEESLEMIVQQDCLKAKIQLGSLQHSKIG